MATREFFGGIFRLAAFAIVPLAFVPALRSYANQPAAAAADPGNTFRIDPGFSTRIESTYSPINTYVVRAATDGGFFAGGNFSTIGGQLHLGLAKFRVDGTLDATFNPNGGFDGIVDNIAVLNDGRLLVAGTFSSFNGTARPGLARLNADGTLDAAFVPPASVNGSGIIAVQSDGRILLAPRAYAVAWAVSGGSGSGSRLFRLTSESIDTTVSMALSRLNADGSADTTFTPPTISESQYVTCLLPLPGGKILVGGRSFTIGSTTYNSIVRLNADGSVDPTFVVAASLNLSPSSLAVQSDGKIVMCGFPSTYVPGPSGPTVKRLNADGSVDTTFQPPVELGFSPNRLLLLPDGKIFVGGYNSTFYGGNVPQPPNTVRLNSDGSVDTTFTPPSLGGIQIESLARLADGRFVAAGYSASLDSSSTASLALISTSGALEPLATANSRCPSNWLHATPLAGGKILVCGDFSWVNDVSRNGIARLNADGSVDTGFNPGTGFGLLVESSVIQPDGKIVVGGVLSSFNGAPCENIVRLNANGSLDTSFALRPGPTPGPDFSGVPLALALQSDGKIVAAGFFSNSSVVRFLSDGTIDTGFAYFAGPLGSQTTAYAVAVQPDGKILVGGDFIFGLSPYDPIQHRNLARLTAEGYIDASFDPGAGANSIVDKIQLRPDGRIFAGGSFSTYNSVTRLGIASIQAGGSLDTAFSPGDTYGNTLTSALQADGRLVIGSFLTASRLARLNVDGTVDSRFTAYDHNGGVSAANFTEDGRLLVTGGMTFSPGVKQIGLSLLKSETYSGSSSSSSSGSSSGTANSGGGGGGAPSAWFVFTVIALLAAASRRKIGG